MCVLQPDRPPTPDLLPSLCTCQRQSHFLQHWIFKPLFQGLRNGNTRLFLWRLREIMRNALKLETVFLFTRRCFTRPVFSQRRRQFRGILAASRLCEECLRASLSPQLLWFQNLEFTGCFLFFSPCDALSRCSAGDVTSRYDNGFEQTVL